MAYLTLSSQDAEPTFTQRENPHHKSLEKNLHLLMLTPESLGTSLEPEDSQDHTLHSKDEQELL